MDLIDRAALREDYALGERCEDCKRYGKKDCDYPSYSARDFCGWLDDAPTVEAEPVRHGKWIHVSGYCTPGGDPVWKCSECGKGIHVFGVEHGTYGKDIADDQWVSCPNCGAKMDGEEW